MHKQAFCDDLENMTSENPIELWEKIKKLGPRKSNSIPVEAYGENVEVITDKNFVLDNGKTEIEKLYNSTGSNEFGTDFQRQALS